MGINSVNKIIEYVSRVSKTPVVVDGEVILQNAITAVKVTDKFFYKDDCVGCGRCCLNENNAWTHEGLHRMREVLYVGGVESVASNKLVADFDMQSYQELEDKLHYFTRDVNGKAVDFWEYPADSAADAQRYSYPDRPANLTRCHWVDLNGKDFMPCKIHLCRSITCGMPHLRFFHTVNSETTSMSISQYGRNHQLGCLVHFQLYDFRSEEHEAGIQSRIVWLQRLNEAANDLGIDTWLPEVLQTLKKGVRTPFVVGAPSHPKLFTVNGL